ncbi:DUF1573 domain-containing protein [Candidatus Bipolaricaulota bacterium]|nr:DUF1573 domain-containing protein [Candidatus Bipolaricaulota bacterium]
MKRLPILLLFIVATIAGTVLADPVIQVDDAVYNVTIQAGFLIEHTFMLSNAGDELLIISDVVPSCGCTTATLETYELEPGQSVELPITIDTTGFSGLVLRVIDVFSNDPVTPILTLTINIDAPGPVGLTPAQLAQRDFLSFFYVLIDVRTPGEFESGHLFGSINIPVTEFQQSLDAWTPLLPKDVPLILYCKGGFRSAVAAQILFDAGFANVIDLLGGMDEWVVTYGDGYLFDPF